MNKCGGKTALYTGAQAQPELSTLIPNFLTFKKMIKDHIGHIKETAEFRELCIEMGREGRECFLAGTGWDFGAAADGSWLLPGAEHTHDSSTGP